MRGGPSSQRSGSSSQHHRAGQRHLGPRGQSVLWASEPLSLQGKHHLSTPSFAVADVPGPPKEAKIALRALTRQGPPCQRRESTLQVQLQAALPSFPDSNSQSRRVSEAYPSQQSAPDGCTQLQGSRREETEVAQL